MQRRDFFQGSAVATAVVLGGCATPTAMQQQRTPFSVPATFIPVAGSDEMFPVRRIYCIGRNYAAHAREMGSDPNREPPFFFQKPTDAIQFVALGTTPDHPYPPLTKNYHYEAELVAAIGKGGRNIPVGNAACLGLHARAGHDTARPAARHGRREEAMGDRQEL
jgi:fumarylpyruvate hydrolase